VLPALDLAGVVRCETNHPPDSHLPYRQGVNPIMQPYYGSALVAVLPQQFEKLWRRSLLPLQQKAIVLVLGLLPIVRTMRSGNWHEAAWGLASGPQLIQGCRPTCDLFITTRLLTWPDQEPRRPRIVEGNQRDCSVGEGS
jgi:hypothetical protein